jgi:hypothetical protein
LDGVYDHDPYDHDAEHGDISSVHDGAIEGSSHVIMLLIGVVLIRELEELVACATLMSTTLEEQRRAQLERPEAVESDLNPS